MQQLISNKHGEGTEILHRYSCLASYKSATARGKKILISSNWEPLLYNFVQADSLEGEKEASLKGVENRGWKYGEAGGEGECRKDLRIIICGV